EQKAVTQRSGTVQNSIQLPVAIPDLRQQLLYSSSVTHIGLMVFHLCSQPCDCFQLLLLLPTQNRSPAQHQPRSRRLMGNLLCEQQPQPTCSSGDQIHASALPHRYGSFCSCFYLGK